MRCGSLVYSVGYRHPAVLANAMATLDQLSDGRITLGLGGGWLADGVPTPTASSSRRSPVRLRQVEEAIQCVRGLLTQDVTNFDGEFFTLTDAQCEPKPVQERLPLWIGGGGEKVTLRTAARHADGWNVPFISPEDYARKVEVLERHCERRGSRPGRDHPVGERRHRVQRRTTSQAQFGKIAEVRAARACSPAASARWSTGSAQYRDAGAEWLILAMRAPFDVDGLDRFAAEVLPQLA